MPPEASVRSERQWLALAVLCVSLLVVSLDSTVLNVALPTLVRDLHASDSQLQWIVDAYAVVFAGFLLLGGSLGDRFGRKWVFLFGLLAFAAGSSGSAFSPTSSWLIGARASMGLGAAAIMPSTLSILIDVFRGEDRARAIGIWSGTTGLGIAIGPVVGGWLLAHYWWGSVFLINVPIALAGALAALVLVPDSKSSAPKHTDFLGSALSTAGLALLVGGIIEIPQRHWDSPVVLGLLAGSAFVLCCFVLVELREREPMLRLAQFRVRRFSVAMGSMALLIYALMGTLFLLTQYFQFSLGYSALQTGVRVMPIAAVLFVVAPTSSLLTERLGTKWIAAAGMVAVAVSLLMLSHVTVHGTYLDALPSLMLLGFGTGLSFPTLTDSVMGSVPLEESSVDAATNSAAIEVGGALGVAVLGSLLSRRYESRMLLALAHHVIPARYLHLILGSLGGALGVAGGVGGPLGRSLASAAREAFVEGMDLALLSGAAAVTVGILAVLLLLPNRPPREQEVGVESREEQTTGGRRGRAA